jgi:DNA-directed RNA polymerase alpha subunit
MGVLSSIELPHWLMIAGAILVVVGFVGLALQKNRPEPAETDEQDHPRLDRRRSGEPNQIDPTLWLPDDTPISDVELPARIRNALVAAGLETVGDVRETADETLLSFDELGKSSVAHIRETLGFPSRPNWAGKKPT